MLTYELARTPPHSSPQLLILEKLDYHFGELLWRLCGTPMLPLDSVYPLHRDRVGYQRLTHSHCVEDLQFCATTVKYRTYVHGCPIDVGPYIIDEPSYANSVVPLS